jgi:hypothetical protein
MRHKEGKQAMQLFSQSSSCSSLRDVNLSLSLSKESYQSLSLKYRLCPVIFGSDRLYWLVLLSAVLFVPSDNHCHQLEEHPVPLPPPGETSLSLCSFLVPKVARAYRTLLCCPVCWCGWAAVAARELVRWTICGRIGNTCG